MKNIKLEAELILEKSPCEVRVRAVDGIWQDFGYWLEVGGFMLHQAAGYKEKS